MRWGVLIALLAVLLPSATADAKVTMYGAHWCGPCASVKAFLTQSRVSFEYVDIDTDQGRERYEAARGNVRSIPLTVIAGESIVGSNFERIGEALLRAKVTTGPAPAVGPYGGHPPEWWQQQFRALRQRLDLMERDIAKGEQVAFDHYEKELLAKLKANREIVAQSIDQLESDASNVSLPRRYRE